MRAQSIVLLLAFGFCAFAAISVSAQPTTESMAVPTTSADEDSTVTARTFGHHFLKRISFAMLPAAFVVGVITTLLAALTIVSMKGLGVGVILLVIAVGQMLGRILPAAAPAFAPTAFQAPAQAPYPVYLKENWRR